MFSVAWASLLFIPEQQQGSMVQQLFLLKGEKKRRGYTDMFLLLKGIAPWSTIVKTENAYMTDLAWLKVTIALIYGYSTASCLLSRITYVVNRWYFTSTLHFTTVQHLICAIICLSKNNYNLQNIWKRDSLFRTFLRSSPPLPLKNNPTQHKLKSMKRTKLFKW